MSLPMPPVPRARRRSRCPKSRRGKYARPQVLLAKGVRIQATPVNLHAQQLFEPDIAQPYPRPKVIEERELTRLGWRLECHDIETELDREAIRQDGAEGSGFIEKPDALGTFPSLHHQFASAGVQPAAPLSDPLLRRVRAEGAGVLLAQLKLHFESPAP